jgi:hypothetical protein
LKRLHYSGELFLCDRRFVDPSRKFSHSFIRKPFIHRHRFSIYKTAGSFIATANTAISLNNRSRRNPAEVVSDTPASPIFPRNLREFFLK